MYLPVLVRQSHEYRVSKHSDFVEGHAEGTASMDGGAPPGMPLQAKIRTQQFWIERTIKEKSIANCDFVADHSDCQKNCEADAVPFLPVTIAPINSPTQAFTAQVFLLQAATMPNPPARNH